MKNITPFISILIAFYTSYKIIPVVIRIARLKNLVDEPNNRTSHKKAIPTLGGVGIFIGFAVASLLLASYYFVPEFNSLLLGMLILFFLGIKDDILVLSAKKKLVGQVIVAFFITFLGDVRLTSFDGILGIYDIPYWPSVLSTMFIFIALINAVNLIDGIDGLASGFGILAATFFGVDFYLLGHFAWAMLCFAMAGSLMAFFLYNVFGNTNKIFMGDTGSLVLGLFITTAMLKFININSVSNGPFSIDFAPVLALSVLVLPIFDTLRVFSIRIANGQSPFHPDKRHIHHLMLRLGFSHKASTSILLATNVALIATCFALQSLPMNYQILVLSSIVFLLIGLLWRLSQKYTHSNTKENIAKPQKIEEIDQLKDLKNKIFEHMN
ncbi:glycosyltransferase family 4 protein [Acetobacteroides hydrogenigenes]|uniref:UDP-N-acetylmuramyl pentapeptide phosphotransferase/UDP-N-acetylglucosamine-1-phosphate transferase n=1 Tax=Acetobacteroides hydrogenigenes TaxID=979970 RepID=A0A4V6NM40_9BACT|nr:MraY family glycosyltransferase [Acetobacteroides hydrogenigenes]TCN73211.1 UDP-N-acetylmuramyl pentapeptide phosphotransferase/UDP-N-acetylglucosamine-1-phosphate transferase [Acetobacteroides hydrogenigenes]